MKQKIFRWNSGTGFPMPYEIPIDKLRSCNDCGCVYVDQPDFTKCPVCGGLARNKIVK